jgi:ketosteroid isomerase-like protein
MAGFGEPVSGRCHAGEVDPAELRRGDAVQPVEVVEQLMERIEARDWAGTAALLHPDVVVEWVATGETFRGASTFVSVQSEYPEGWNVHPIRFVAAGRVVVSEIDVPQVGVGLFRAVSIWEVEDGLIVSGREYWTSPGSEQPPEWRRRYAS